MSEGLMDYPNRQALGLDPPWEEAGAEPQAQTQAAEGLDAMTKEELLEYAQSAGVSPANKNMTKDELRASIDEHESE